MRPGLGTSNKGWPYSLFRGIDVAGYGVLGLMVVRIILGVCAVLSFEVFHLFHLYGFVVILTIIPKLQLGL